MHKILVLIFSQFILYSLSYIYIMTKYSIRKLEMVLPKHVTKSDLENIKGLRFFCVTAGMNYPDSNQFAKFSDIHGRKSQSKIFTTNES